MFNKILILLIATIGLAACDVAGDSSKAEINSKCTLNGGGDYKCIFSNKGKKEGSLCEHLLLSKKKVEAHIIIGFLPDISNEKPAELDDEILGFKNVLNKIRSTYTADDFQKFVDDPANNINTFKQRIYTKQGYALSDELCSGLVKAGDIREVSGSTRFFRTIPMEVCTRPGLDWTEACDFTSISSQEVNNEMYKVLNTK